jgi:hypothetical protein
MTGDMDQTGPPLRFDGWCDIFVNGIGEASVTITATRPDVMFCIGTTCGTSYTLKWKDIVRSIGQTVAIDVFKAPNAPASQLLGGGRSVVNIYIEYYDNKYVGYTTLDVYVNGTRIASCYRRTSVSKETTFWTEYVPPNATGDYLFRIVGISPSGQLVALGADLTLYDRGGGSYGFALTTNPIENATKQDLQINANYYIPIKCPSGSEYYAFVADEVVENEIKAIGQENDFWLLYLGPLIDFSLQLYYNDTLRNTFCRALDAVVDTEFDVPYIATNRTGEYLVYHTYISKWSGSAMLRFKTISISSFGAVYANVILPIDINLPPPAIELPPTLPSNQSSSSSQQPSLSELLKLVPKIITVFKG